MGLGLFVSSLEPNILKELRDNFKFPEDQLYLTSKEYKDLGVLLADKMPEMSSMQLLCDHLAAKIPPIPEISDLDHYKIVFPEYYLTNGEKIELSNARKVFLNSKFIALFREANPNSYELESLIIEIATGSPMIEGAMNDKDRIILKDFFVENKDLVAHFLQTPDGVQKMNDLLMGVGDGCVANFATNFKIASHKSLITDPCDLNLYLFFLEKIVAKILGEKGKDHLGGDAQGTDIFTNKEITATFLSPNSLVVETLKMVTSDNKIAQEIIQKEFERLKAEDAQDKMGELVLASLNNAINLLFKKTFRALLSSIFSPLVR